MDLNKIQLIEFPMYGDEASSLSVYDTSSHVPFSIKRVFSVTANKADNRGEHAHKKCIQLLICTHGKVQVICKNKDESKEYSLSTKNRGILIPPMIWASQKYLEDNTVLTVLCSHSYEEEDYIRNHNEYLNYNME
jgi:dTDP-4-dehydrorhamnose 3,5-epimerase-like enzyme